MARRGVLILLLVQAAAYWPVWKWAAARVVDGDADEIVALIACAAALLVPPARRSSDAAGLATQRVGDGTASADLRIKEPLSRLSPSMAPSVERRLDGPPPPLVLSTALTLAYATSVLGAPELLQAMLACCALLAMWCAWRWGTRPHPAALGLMVLALPALPTAQFVLGYPLRAAAGELAARLLGLAGFAVARDGVALRWGAQLVAIDAPCSGVNMLWTALLLAFLLALWGGLSWRRTALLGSVATALAIAGNGLRAASLFLVESGAVKVPASFPAVSLEAVHVALGLVAFALAAGPLLLMFARWKERSATCAPSPLPLS